MLYACSACDWTGVWQSPTDETVQITGKHEKFVVEGEPPKLTLTLCGPIYVRCEEYDQAHAEWKKRKALANG
jgi:hypothetical protein